MLYFTVFPDYNYHKSFIQLTDVRVKQLLIQRNVHGCVCVCMSLYVCMCVCVHGNLTSSSNFRQAIKALYWKLSVKSKWCPNMTAGHVVNEFYRRTQSSHNSLWFIIWGFNWAQVWTVYDNYFIVIMSFLLMCLLVSVEWCSDLDGLWLLGRSGFNPPSPQAWKASSVSVVLTLLLKYYPLGNFIFYL